MQTDRPTVIEADYRVTESGEIVPGGDKKSGRLRALLGPLAAVLIFVATKLKFLLAALKGVKFLGTGLSAIVSVGAYALAFNWQFGVGLVVLLFILSIKISDQALSALPRFPAGVTACPYPAADWPATAGTQPGSEICV